MWFVMDERKSKPVHMYWKNNLDEFSWHSEETENGPVLQKREK